MLSISAILACIIGFFLSVILIITAERGFKPNRMIHSSLSFVINLIRSLPFLILMVCLIPFTRMLVGSSVGQTAAIVPLTIVAAPFFARVFEGGFNEVDFSLVEAAQSFGASKVQIIFLVMLPEAIPAFVAGVCLGVISLLGETTMAGAIGAGGLGAVAITYGYQNFNDRIMYLTVVVLIILVQIIQFIGDFLYNKLK
jgi:D-methionine transport system permease protein